MFKYKYQNLARLCRDIIRMEQGDLDEIRMDSLWFRCVVAEAMHYVRCTDFLTRHGDVSLVHRVAASLEECLIVSAIVSGDKEGETHARHCRKALDKVVRDYPIREEDYAFLRDNQSLSLPEWKDNNNKSFLHQFELNKFRYMDADGMIDEEEDASEDGAHIDQTSDAVSLSPTEEQ